jgi:hypothetical protein
MRALRLAAIAAYRKLFGQRRTDHLLHGWREMRRHPEVIRDLCTLGHIYEADVDPETGQLYDDRELRARSARKSMVLALLARAEITDEELSIIRTEQRYDDFETHDGADG